MALVIVVLVCWLVQTKIFEQLLDEMKTGAEAVHLMVS